MLDRDYNIRVLKRPLIERHGLNTMKEQRREWSEVACWKKEESRVHNKQKLFFIVEIIQKQGREHSFATLLVTRTAVVRINIVYVYMYTRVPHESLIHVYVNIAFPLLHMSIYVCTHIYIYTYIYECIHICVHVCVYVYVYTRIYKNIYIYSYIFFLIRIDKIYYTNEKKKSR